MAIILVVADRAAFGSIAVNVFFVLSEFVITSILLYEKDTGCTLDPARLYWRRALRLFPAFAASLAVVVLHFDFVTMRKQGFSHPPERWAARSRPRPGAVAV